MTADEKIAHEYAIENWEHYEEGQSDYDVLKQAVLYGLKVGRPKWHDLRKDPNNLPKEVGHYIVCYLDTAGERHTFELSFVDWFEDKHWIDEDNHNIEGYDEGVIAWCEIQQYTEE